MSPKPAQFNMTKSNFMIGSWTALFMSIAMPVFAQATIAVDVDKPGHAVSPLLWGIFFEDINLSADGGIYPELVRNRSFEDAARPEYWRLLNVTNSNSQMAIDDSEPLNPLNHHCLRVNTDGPFVLENEGYWGMNIISGDHYALQFAARATDGFTGTVEVRIVDATGKELADGNISGPGDHWNYYSLDLVALGSDPKAKLQISSAGKGTLFLDMVSLMPNKTWKDHGLRVGLGGIAGGIASVVHAFSRRQLGRGR